MIFKCKMCGANINFDENTGSVAECEYCGTAQTLPKSEDERILNQINRANQLRQNGEFDRAIEIYERILNTVTDDSEIYWNLVLCKYGIEYVEDPFTHKRLATCHRTRFGSVLEDADYLSALKFADVLQKSVYKSEAEYIDKVQKGIFEISNKEEPFDVFICYKESDNSRRTPDSVLAQELYYGLTNEGFRVFFARITLEGKLGTAYEPYIFAALNSARVMVIMGTKPEYFNAPWVKNEWVRFLDMMKDNKEKVIIPAYKDMDPYDLPDALSMFQAQDMSKLGFMQDLISGIKKITAFEKKTAIKETVKTASRTNYLGRAQVFLEDGEFDKALEYFDKALDEDPQNSNAYLGKVLAGSKAVSLKDLAEKNIFSVLSLDFKRALRYSSGAQNIQLSEFKNNADRKIENIRKRQGLYNSFISILKALLNQKRKEEQLRIEEERRKRTEEIQKEQRRIEEEQRREQEKINEERKKISQKNKAKYDTVIAEDKNNIELYAGLISIGYDSVLGLKNDGTVVSLANKEKVKDWRNIIAVSSGYCFHLALRSDGYVVATGKNDRFQCNVPWQNIIAIAAGDRHSVGLKSNGTVVAAGMLNGTSLAQCKVANWQNIIAISAGCSHTLGLKSDGTVVCAGMVCAGSYNDEAVKGWSNITAISSGNTHALGLKSDGTVMATGRNNYGQCNVHYWNNIIAIAAGNNFSVGLKSDGTVVATGYNEFGGCNVGDWHDIIAIAAGSKVLGLRNDGTVISTLTNNRDKEEVEGWVDISLSDNQIEALKANRENINFIKANSLPRAKPQTAKPQTAESQTAESQTAKPKKGFFSKFFGL